MPSELGLSFDGSETPDALRAMVKTADEGGASTVWLASHLFQREPIATAALALANAKNISIALMAMSPYSVHPLYATMAAATLDEYFPGRVKLCFGVGAPRDLEAAGPRRGPLPRTHRHVPRGTPPYVARGTGARQ